MSITSVRLRTLYIPTTGTPLVRASLIDDGNLISLLGDPVTRISPANGWLLWVNRDAQLSDQPANPLANRLARHVNPTFAQVLYGSVLVAGTGEAGAATDLCWHLIDLARTLA